MPTKKQLKARLAAARKRARARRVPINKVVEKLNKISNELLARSKYKTKKPSTAKFDIFTPAVPPPGVVPQDAPPLAMDSAASAPLTWAAGAGFGGVFAEGLTFLGYPYLAELSQRPEYRVISETIATEMTRKWITLQSSSEDDKAKDKRIKELTDYLEDFKVQDCFTQICENDGFFGRSHLYIDTGNTDNPQELMLPIGNGRDEISKAKLEKGCLKSLRVIEPVWTYPTNYNATDPLKRDWYNPEVWYVMGKQIHRSRLLTFVGRPVPDLLKPAYSFGGLSLSQMAKPYVDNWLETRQHVNDIIRSFTVFVLATDMNTLLTPGGAELFDRIELFNNNRDNQGTMVINKDKEDFKNVSAPLSTLDALQAQAQEHMAAVSRIPLVKLLGIQPAGLNATSEGEIRTFYDSIAAYQQRFFKAKLTQIIDIAMVSLWGVVDPDIHFVFEPLWSLDEKTLADKRKVDADTDAVYLGDNVISQEEVRKKLANDPDSGYAGIDVDDVPENDDGGENVRGIGLGQGGGLGGESNFREAAE